MRVPDATPVAWTPAVSVGDELVLPAVSDATVSTAAGSPARYQVVGIGNALVDVIAHAPDSFLAEHQLVKGSMALVETDRAVHLYRALGSAVEMSGGSAANTMCGVASLGGRAAYIGKVSEDDLGRVFGHDLHAVGVRSGPVRRRRTPRPGGASSSSPRTPSAR